MRAYKEMKMKLNEHVLQLRSSDNHSAKRIEDEDHRPINMTPMSSGRRACVLLIS